MKNKIEITMEPAALPAGGEQNQLGHMSDIPRGQQIYVGHSNNTLFLCTKNELDPDIVTLHFETDFLEDDLNAGILEQFLLKYGKYPRVCMSELEENGDVEYYKFRAAVLKTAVRPYEMLLSRKIEVE